MAPPLTTRTIEDDALGNEVLAKDARAGTPDDGEDCQTPVRYAGVTGNTQRIGPQMFPLQAIDWWR